MRYLFYILLLVRSCVLTGPTFAQTWTPEMQKFACHTEKTYGLPSGMCRAFALQESNYQPFAERVEANYVEKSGTYAAKIRATAYAFAKAHNWQPSFLTEVYQMGKSVTLFQIMGVNMRAMGYDAPFMNYVSLTDQFEYFGKFVRPLLKKHNGNIASVASEYNGGYGAVAYKSKHGRYRNQSYVDKILKYIAKFSTS